MNEIYGIDISKRITPIMVRDAIIICFKQAHKEVLDMMDEYAEWSSESEREEIKNLQIELTVKNAFKDANVDFTNPKKEELINILDNLATLAAMFRKPEIIEKHYNEIKLLIGKTE